MALRTIRGSVFGRTRSGKTEWLARRWLARESRLLIWDETGEWKLRSPGATFAVGLPATIDALHRHATDPRWQIVAYLDPGEHEALAARLLPRGRLDQSYPNKIGGMALLIDEADVVLGLNPAPSLRALARRSGHGGLSVFLATQRPNIHKDFPSQGDFIAVLATHEPNDVDYFADLMGRDTATRALEWVNSPEVRYRVAVYESQGRVLHLMDPMPLTTTPERTP